MEPLIDPSVKLEPAQIPHHKGRKRMHLEVKESIKKVSTEVKQKLVDAVSALSSTLQRRDSVNSDQVNATKAQVSVTAEILHWIQHWISITENSVESFET